MKNRRLFPPERVLVATDMGETSAAAMSVARYLHEHHGSRVHVLHAHHFEPPVYFSSGQLQALTAELKDAARAVEDQVEEEARKALGFSPEVTVAEAPPVEAILAAIRGLDIDLAIMGTHGRSGVQRLWLGSVTERVIRLSPRPVLALRHGWPQAGIGSILCPVNCSDAGLQAFEYAAATANAEKARLAVLHSVESAQVPEEFRLACDRARAQSELEELIVRGEPAKAILEAVHERSPDLVIMGGERRVTALGEVFSSTTERVMRHTGAPILVVPRVV
jgi:nucleotide-binding universal stress UspA family protein